MAGRGIHLPPERRHTGMVFQEYARFPYLTVAKNVAFGMPQQQMAQLLVDLSEQASRYPHLLSGNNNAPRWHPAHTFCCWMNLSPALIKTHILA